MNEQIQELEALLESVRRIIRERDAAMATAKRLERENGELLDEVYELRKGKVA